MKYIGLFLALVIFFSCDEDELKKREYPTVKTEIQISDSGVLLQGGFLQEGSLPVNITGFYWGAENDLTNEILLDDRSDLTYLLNSVDFSSERTYSASFFVRNEKYEAQGNIVSFTTEKVKRLDPEVLSVSNLDVMDLGEVLVTGHHFSQFEENIDITFDGINSEVVELKEDTILFRIPPGLGEGEIQGQLRVYENSVSLGSFNILSPLIESISLSEAYDDTDVVLNGRFSSNCSITLGTANVTPISINETEIVIKTPKTSLSGLQVLKVENSGEKSDNVDFTILDHQVTSISPENAKIGDLITITGSGFEQLDRVPKIEVEGEVATISSWNDSEIQFRLPNHMAGEVSNIEVINGAKSRSTEIIKLDSWSELPDFPGAQKSRRFFAHELDDNVFIGFDYRGTVNNVARSGMWKLNKTMLNWSNVLDIQYSAGYELSFVFETEVLVYRGGTSIGRVNFEENLIENIAEPTFNWGSTYLSYGAEPIVLGQKVYALKNSRIYSYDFVLEESVTENFYPAMSTPNYFLKGIEFDGEIYWIGKNKIYRYTPGINSLVSAISLGSDLTRRNFIHRREDSVFFGDGSIIYEWNLITMEIFRRENLPIYLENALAFEVNGETWIGFGENNSEPSNRLWSFNPY